jgi:hypothetical protein
MLIRSACASTSASGYLHNKFTSCANLVGRLLLRIFASCMENPLRGSMSKHVTLCTLLDESSIAFSMLSRVSSVERHDQPSLQMALPCFSAYMLQVHKQLADEGRLDVLLVSK